MDARVVVVTGASAGIGRAIAIRFAQAGWRVGMLARGEDGLAGACRDVQAAGGQPLAIPVDVADARAVEAAAERIERELGPIDVWVNNAMATIFCDVMRIDPDDWRRATDVTFHGAVWGTQAALRRMLPRDCGIVVQVGSALAYRSIPLQAPYCAAKSALRGFTDSLRSELIHARSRVRLTMVHLSAFNTPQFDWAFNRMPGRPRPVGRPYQPEVAAEAVFQAAMGDRREWRVGLPAVTSILGQTFVPGWLDGYLARTAWDGQMEPDDGRPRRDNLHAPVPGDAGAHGRFDDRAKTTSPQWWVTTHRGDAALVALGVALAALAVAGISERALHRGRT